MVTTDRINSTPFQHDPFRRTQENTSVFKSSKPKWEDDLFPSGLPTSQFRRWYLRWIWIRLKITSVLTEVRKDRAAVVAILTAIVLGLLLVVDQRFEVVGTAKLAIDTLIPILQVVLGAIFSLELFSYDTDPVDRNRLRSPQEVVEYYDDIGINPGFVSTEDYLGRAQDQSSQIPDTLPVVPEMIPDSPRPLEEMAVRLEDTFFSLPDRFQELLSPVLERMRTRFVDEGHFNQMKLRPMQVSPTELVLGKTTFFNNFAANLCADWYVYDSRCPRDLLHSVVFTESGNLRELQDNPMPYIAASSGLVISESGQTVLPVRSREVVIQGRQLGESFGGSWDWDTVRDEGMEAQVRYEFKRERMDHVDPELFHLGMMRRVDLMGKTDLYVCGYVEGDPDWQERSREHTFPVVVDILPEGDTFDSPSEIFEHPDAVIDSVLDAIIDSPFAPSLGLLTWLWLFNHTTTS